MNQSGRIITLLGPTASGKTALACAIAERFAVDLISVDSGQIYRGMDIGTAKPPPALLRRYPHALINIREPEQPYSAAEFCADTQALVAESHSRGRIPLLSGGSMLYFHALFAGLSDLPRSDLELRAEIEAQIAREGLAKLYAALIAKDPLQAQNISPNDSQRIIRFTELIRITGKTPSQLFTERLRLRPHWSARHFALLPERVKLHQRIAQRFDHMMAQGFLQEVEKLHRRPALTAKHPSMRSVGYRQLFQYLNGQESLEEAVARGVIATRQLAKRQCTWINNRLLKSMPLEFFDPEHQQTPERIFQAIDAWITH